MRLKRASEINLEKIDWLWKGRFPSSALSIIEGDPGTSKSTLVADIAAKVSTGANWPTGEAAPSGSCVILNAEDPVPSVLLPRLMAAGANLANIHVIVPSSENDNESFTIPDHVDSLKRLIQNQNVKMVSFDPLEAFLSPATDNRNNQQIRRALRSLELLAQQTGCAVLLVRHLTKDTTKAAIYRGGGSIGIVGGARAAVLVSKDLSDPAKCLMVPHKTSWAPPGTEGLSYRLETVEVSDGNLSVEIAKLHWLEGTVSVSADDILAQSVEVGIQIATKDAAEFLRAALQGGPKDANQLSLEATGCGISAGALFQAAKLVGARRVGSQWTVTSMPFIEGGISLDSSAID